MKTLKQKQKQEQIALLRRAVELVTGRIDGYMGEEKELARANRILCRLLGQLREEIKPLQTLRR